ncbi:MAG: ABC transporter permease [Candidatus Abyssobacteria bacterium SURF_17]|uniref:ABC transporter permease n=1 Tax=Candidatus Abyssobacteria bacterium SURF_17 TaxID=2093361 RepID=A0A419EP83_9BACT|nr:MAG: ABC transporter permease [Candidatus Abyssubacteria bacterium SURF_17]
MVTSLLGFIGNRTQSIANEAKRLGRLTADAFDWSFIAPLTGRGIKWKSVLRHMVIVGFDSIPIICFICVLVGAIIAMQSAYQLKHFGAVRYIPPLVGVGMTRELGPLIAAIIMAGRSGSAFTAEIGTMVVSEEVDALKTMVLEPVKFLVVPKFIAMMVMQPCLTMIADLVGMFGGFLVAITSLEMAPNLYLAYTIDYLVIKDIITGLVKSVAFGTIIALVGCHYGFAASGGAEGVGKATTRAVVTSIFLVIVADCVFTALFYFAF